MRRANAPSAVGERGRAADRVERAEPAGRLEQRRGLQLAAAQVALDRDVRGAGVLALQQLAFGQRRAGLRERLQLLGVLVARELGEGAREQQVAGRDRDVAAPAAAATVGRPRRSCAPSIRSSWTSVAECTSSTATAARTSRSSPSAPRAGPPADSAASTTSSGRSRLPPAATVAFACAASGAPASAVTRVEMRLGACHRARAARAAASHDRVERRRRPARAPRRPSPDARSRASAGTVPTWIATMPPAVSR